jgi:hypothetical protein
MRLSSGFTAIVGSPRIEIPDLGDVGCRKNYIPATFVKYCGAMEEPYGAEADSELFLLC